MMGSERDEIIKELFKHLLQKHQEWLEESMRGSEFVFDSADLLKSNSEKNWIIICRFSKMAKQ